MEEVEASGDNREQFSQELNKLRQDDQLLDFTACVSEQSIKAHKVVLAANSEFFKAMLTNSTYVEQEGQVNLEDIDPDIVQIIVDFWYTNKMNMTSTNISSLLLAASRFGAKTALEVCIDFAGANLTPTNCLIIAVVCERVNLNELDEKAFVYCLRHFKDIVQETEFLGLDEQFFTKIISDNQLNAGNEIYVLEAIIRWVQFDESHRSGKLEKLMHEVRFASIDPVPLLKLAIRDQVKISEEYKNIFTKAMAILLLRNQPDLYQEYIGEFKSEPRKPIASSDHCLFVFGGPSVQNSEVYDSHLDEWYFLSETLAPVNFAVSLSENSIYAIGAGKDVKPQYYNADKDEWSYGDLLFDGPATGCMVALNGYIYSFGESDNGYITSLTRYELTKKTWFKCAPVQELREDPGFAVHNGYIYVMGGSKTDSKHAMVSVERYNPSEDRWEFVASMKRPRKLFGSCSFKGKLYVAGGINCGVYMNEAEMYNPELDIWTEIEPMSVPRAGAGLVELSGRVYAVGGQTKDYHLDAVEAYDPDSNEWVRKQPLREARSAHCVLVARIDSKLRKKVDVSNHDDELSEDDGLSDDD